MAWRSKMVMNEYEDSISGKVLDRLDSASRPKWNPLRMVLLLWNISKYGILIFNGVTWAVTAVLPACQHSSVQPISKGCVRQTTAFSLLDCMQKTIPCKLYYFTSRTTSIYGARYFSSREFSHPQFNMRLWVPTTIPPGKGFNVSVAPWDRQYTIGTPTDFYNSPHSISLWSTLLLFLVKIKMSSISVTPMKRFFSREGLVKITAGIKPHWLRRSQVMKTVEKLRKHFHHCNQLVTISSGRVVGKVKRTSNNTEWSRRSSRKIEKAELKS